MAQRRLITTWHLAMDNSAKLRPSRREVKGLTFTRAQYPSPELNRYLYTAIGGDWYWIDRLSWTWKQWDHYVSGADVETWLANLHGTPVGYVELLRTDTHTIKIEYLGVLSRLAGQGIGGLLLTMALERGFALGAQKVWLHTCSLDHPNALAAYQARGLEVFHTNQSEISTPDETPGPWLGSKKPLMT